MKKRSSNSLGAGIAPVSAERRKRQPLLRRCICLLLCCVMLLGVTPLNVLAAKVNEGAHPFTDVSAQSWYADAVQYVYEHGIFSGTGAATFTPDGTMTRGMFVTVLGRMAGVDTANYAGESAFRDVPQNAYYAPYVAWAAKYGVTTGTGKDTFSPDKLIDREEMAAFFARYFKTFGVEYDVSESVTTRPADLDEVSDWAKESVLTLWQAGLLTGTGEGVEPKGNATRAQAAMLCMRIHKAVKEWFNELGNQGEEPVTPGNDSAGGSSSSGGSGEAGTQYYKVGFALGSGLDNTGLKLPETAMPRSGTKISELPTPYQPGKIFLGWYYDSALGQRARTDDAIDKDMTLYAKMTDVEKAALEQTPAYLTKKDVKTDFVFYVKAESEEDVKEALTVTQITAGNKVLDWGASDGLSVEKAGDYFKVSGAFAAGQTYQATLDDSNVVFVVDNEEQPVSVRELNFITAKEEVMNLTLREGLVYIPKTDVDFGKNTPLDGLFTADAMDGSRIKSVHNAGSFTYNGSGTIKAGDTVAIYEGEIPNERSLKTNNDDTIVYVTVTKVDGSTVSYTTADIDDILFVPDVLPVEEKTAGSTTSPLTLTGDDVKFSQYGVPGLDDGTTIDKGDYIAFFTGDFQTTGRVTGYACITDVTLSGDTYTITYQDATEEEMKAAMDLYSTRPKDITLTDAKKRQVEREFERQIRESNYAEKAIETLSLMAWESDDLDDLNAKLNSVNGMRFSLQANNAGGAKGDGKAKDSYVFDALKNLKKNTQWKKDLLDDKSAKVIVRIVPGYNTHFKRNGSIGLHASIEYEVKTPLNTIDDTSNELVIKISAEFEQDVMLDINTSGGAVWAWKWIFPYIQDYQLNANLDLGTYTGVGVSFAMNTGEAKDDDDDDSQTEEKKDEDKLMFLGIDWSFLWGDPDEDDDDDDDREYHGIIGKYAEQLGAKINKIAEDGGEFLPDDESTGDDSDNLRALREQYAALIEDADDTWIKLVDKEIFTLQGSVDPLHILVYGVKASFVVKLNAYATLGTTFEYSNAKRYTFSLLLWDESATNKVIDLETSNLEFVFYIMGTLGLRAGLELQLAAGLVSLKLDSVGITAEVGAYATACGFFYYKLAWEAGKGSDTVEAGAFHAESGLYVDVKFNAKLFNSDTLSYERQLYENQLPLFTVGERENVYAFNWMLPNEEHKNPQEPVYTMNQVKTLRLPTELFDMAYMDMQTGELFGREADDEKENPAKNYDDRTESRFDISLSNPKFNYFENINAIYVSPAGSVEETCEMTITWKGNSVAFSSKPISLTVTINWNDYENARYIEFDSQGGSIVDPISATIGAEITAPRKPEKRGYDFGGWYEDKDFTKPFTVPATMPDYGADKGITVYAKWSRNNESVCTVEHYMQQLNGTYVLAMTTEANGETDKPINPVTILLPDTPGFEFKSKKTINLPLEADGSTVIKLYYDRLQYTLRFTYGDGVEGAKDYISRVKYGAKVSAPVLNRKGYAFADWDKPVPETMPAEDMTYKATWTKKEKVQLYAPNGNLLLRSADDYTYLELEPDTPLAYTISYYNDDKIWVEDAIVAYWEDMDTGDDYCNGSVVGANVKVLQAVLMDEETPMQINSEEQLKKIANENWMTGNYLLVDTVELTSNWPGLGTFEAPFSGTFDNSSKNNKIVYKKAKHPFIAYASGATITNLVIEGALTSSDDYVGGVLGAADQSTISKCTVQNAQITAAGSEDTADTYAGGIAGMAGQGCTISDCTVQKGRIIANKGDCVYVGGVVGSAGYYGGTDTVTISACTVKDMMLIGPSDARSCYAGGIAGQLMNGNVGGDSASTIRDCTIQASSNGEYASSWAGGAVGCALNSNCKNVNVQDCIIKATSAGNTYSGGIAGELMIGNAETFEISGCSITGNKGSGCFAESTDEAAFAFAAGVAGMLTLSPANPSNTQISDLTIDGAEFTAKGTNLASAQIIGGIHSSESAVNTVIISYEGISADVDDLVGSKPDNATSEAGTSSWTITCPATGGGGSVLN